MSILSIHVGMDYHTETVRVCAMDDQGRTLGNKPCRNDAEAIRSFAEQFGAVQGAAIEACSGAADLAEELIQKASWNVSLAHPGYVAAMKSSPDKHDKEDSHALADLQRLGYLPRVWLAPRGLRELRSLVRFRQQLVNQRRKTKVRITALLRERRLFTSEHRWTRNWISWMEQVDLGEHGSWIRTRLMESLKRLNKEIREVEQRLEEFTVADPIVKKLLEKDCIGHVTAWTMRAEIGCFERFRTGKQLSRFCGVTPCNASSGKRMADAGLIRASNPQLRAIMIELGQRLRRCEPHYREMSQNMKKAGKPGSVITAAVANRYLRKLFHEMRVRRLTKRQRQRQQIKKRMLEEFD